MRSIYGEEDVQTFGQAGYDGFELLVTLPATGVAGGGGRWSVAFMPLSRVLIGIPAGLPYPHVSPLLCPKHDRLREANRPRLMEAIGEVCRQTLGAPMFFIICEWLHENGDRFLVRAGGNSQEENVEPAEAEGVRGTQRDLAVQRALNDSEAKAQREQEDADERAKRVEYLQRCMAEEQRELQTCLPRA
eukprot:s1651_g5.t1